MLLGELSEHLDKKEMKVFGATRKTKHRRFTATLTFDNLDIRSPDKRRRQAIFNKHMERIHFLLDEKERKLNSLKRGDELPSGVQQMVKVYVPRSV